jgi:hypothetical protein
MGPFGQPGQHVAGIARSRLSHDLELRAHALDGGGCRLRDGPDAFDELIGRDDERAGGTGPRQRADLVEARRGDDDEWSPFE